VKCEGERVLLCFALEEEAVPIRKRTPDKPGVSVLVTGIGRKNAKIAVGRTLALDKPERVFTCGFAGGLNPGLKPGDVVFETDDTALAIRLAATGAKPAKFHCSARVAVTTVEKAELRRATGADAVEMESGAIQALCRERGIPCATVRVISDTANEDLPLDFNKLAKPDLSIDYGKLALAIAKSPGRTPALLRLRKQTRFAAERLAEVLAKVIWP
jgi:adenosylhomocysteine nucleosidase